jgi:hypothetical protein
MLNIQKKWKNVMTVMIYQKNKYRECITEIKNKFKDLICFNPPLFKMFDWFVEEMSQIDFKDSHYVTSVISEEMELQSLLFKVSIFRWQNLYSENISGTIDFQYL